MALFPSQEWLDSLQKKLNTDTKYAQIAKNWEGDLLFQVEPSGALTQPFTFYFNLWHGNCPNAFIYDGTQKITPALSMKGTYDNTARVLKGDLEIMQALMTRKFHVQGNMVLVMRNVPTVLDFVRCCREVTDSFI